MVLINCKEKSNNLKIRSEFFLILYQILVILLQMSQQVFSHFESRRTMAAFEAPLLRMYSHVVLQLVLVTQYLTAYLQKIRVNMSR